jgi:hypothetical protein
MVSFLSLLAAMALPQAPDAEKSQALPLEVAEVIEFELEEGTSMSLATLDQIWPVKKPLPKQFWWEDVPSPASTAHGGAP